MLPDITDFGPEMARLDACFELAHQQRWQVRTACPNAAHLISFLLGMLRKAFHM
jgi:hypothetical protein